MQALDREADVGTRFGGRFVQSVNGIEGSLSARRDWFYFVNGIEADRGATEYRLNEGDILWWDFHAWGGQRRARVVGRRVSRAVPAWVRGQAQTGRALVQPSAR